MDDILIHPDDHAPVVPPGLSVYEKVNHVVNKAYLPHLSALPVVPCPDTLAKQNVSESACFFPICRVAFDRAENNLEKLITVYSGASAVNANVAMLIDGTQTNAVNIYLGVYDAPDRGTAKDTADVVYRNFTGNFPGCKLDNNQDPILDLEQTEAVVNRCFSSSLTSVASVSGISSLRVKPGEDNKAFFQGIEKVINAMEGVPFSALILAHGISTEELSAMRDEYEMLYTRLAPFSKYAFSVNQNTSDATSKTLSDAVSDMVSSSKMHSVTIGDSVSHSHTSGESVAWSGSVGVRTKIPKTKLGFNTSLSRTKTTQKSDTDGQTHQKSDTDSYTDTSGQTVTVTTADGTVYTVSTGQTVQLNYENKSVSEILQRIEQQLKRLRSAEGSGMFAAAAYFFAKTVPDAKAAASTYKAVISGENSGLENTTLNAWPASKSAPVLQYLRKLAHPLFELDETMLVTPASMVTAGELALHMGLPKDGVRGIPVTETVSFGRNVLRLDGKPLQGDQIPMGQTWHLGRCDGNAVTIPLDTMTRHASIFGFTGSGKSHTIYGIVKFLTDANPDVRFMVIEPVKGHYKHDLADLNIQVYGTNPWKSKLLRLDPFYFPEEIHVLEHLDRLVGLFNVCWPMYAAMPAVLKKACAQAYAAAGWDLTTSCNRYGVRLFPTLQDVSYQVSKIMESSKYSQDNKGDYIGSLCTRLDDLSVGLNGMIFTSDGLTDQELFEENVIVDLSRMDAPESKALVMGMLVLRLQEYRASQERTDGALQHITVLEEAHQLLKRTSTEQQMESANLMGRSVEMLTNALAEMRASGEAFIIADQSPSAVDLAAIRNTNTKIIMNLPEQTDREIVGRSIGLTPEQIEELANLPVGVAAIYQNGWQEAVLTKFDPYPKAEKKFSFTPSDEDMAEAAEESLLNAIVKRELDGWVDQLEGDAAQAILRMHLPTYVKIQLLDFQKAKGMQRLVALAKVAYEFFNTQQVFKESLVCKDIDQWKTQVLRKLTPSTKGFDQADIDVLLMLLLREQSLRDETYVDLYLCFAESLRDASRDKLR